MTWFADLPLWVSVPAATVVWLLVVLGIAAVCGANEHAEDET